MYVAQSICIWDSVWQAWVSQIIYYSDLLASPFPPPTQILAPFWLKYLMFASPTLLEPEAILSGVVGGCWMRRGWGGMIRRIRRQMGEVTPPCDPSI